MDRVGRVASRVDREAKDFMFVIVLGMLAAISLAIVFYLYRMHFSGGFSFDAGDWSDFGGYFGGVLGPIVSVLTLLTVFKTVFLQREMIKLQDETFKEQIKQAEALALDSAQAKLDARKTILLNSLDRTINTCIRDVERLILERNESLKFVVLLEGSNQAISSELVESLERLQGVISVIEGRKNQLESLSYMITVSDQTSIEDLQNEFKSGMSRIFAERMN